MIVEYSKIASPEIKRYYSFWKQKCAGRKYPGIKDIDADELPEASPYIYFAEIHYLPLRIFYTSVGAKVKEHDETDFSNQWLLELEEWDYLSKLGELTAIKILIRKQEPIFGAEHAFWKETNDVSIEWGMFPLSDDNKTITHLINYNSYSEL